MRRIKKEANPSRLLSILMAFLLMFTGLLAGCGQDSDKKGNDGAGGTKITETKKQSESAETIYPFTITDSFDRKVTLKKEPQKVVSISPAVTEIVFALGQQDKLIGRTDYCSYPEEAAQIESIGDLMSPNIEKIVDMEPDVVIASAHFQKEVLQKLEDAGQTVVILYGEESFDGAYEAIGKIGGLFNARKAASGIIDDMKATVADVEKRVEGKEKPSVYYVVGFGEMGDYTAGKDTFVGQMIEMAGGKNAADDVEGWNYSLEKLLEKNPDVLICSKADHHKEQLKTANGYQDLDAVKNGKILEIDKNKLEIQGPRLADGLKEIAKYIHPEAFK